MIILRHSMDVSKFQLPLQHLPNRLAPMLLMFFGDRESACSLIKELNFHKMLSKSTWSLIVDLTTKPAYVSLEQNLLLYFVSANVTCHFEAVELQSSQLIYIIVCFFFLYNSTVLLSNFVTSVIIDWVLIGHAGFFLFDLNMF